MEKEYSAILLTTSGDFLVEDKQQIEKKEHGIEAEKPYVINEEETAQRIQAEKMFIPYMALDSIQYGSFNHETV
jgi:hypothetical protein